MNRRALRNRRIRGRMYGGVEGGVSNGAPYPMYYFVFSQLMDSMVTRAKSTMATSFLSIVTVLVLLTGCSDSHEQQEVNFQDRLSDIELNAMKPHKEENVLLFGFDLRDSPEEDAHQYLPFLSYLSRATGYPFELRFTPEDEEIIHRLGSGKVQFAAIGAGSYIEARQKYGVEILARGRNPQGKAEYQSLIVVPPQSTLERVADLKGKHFAFGSVSSTQGHIIPRIIMAKQGVSLSDLESYTYTGSHANCANAVVSGKADACGLQDNMGARLAKEGKVRVLHASNSFPSSGIAVNPEVSVEVRNRVLKALLEFDPQGRDAAGLYHWDRTEMPRGFQSAKDEDYRELRDWGQRLKEESETGQ